MCWNLQADIDTASAKSAGESLDAAKISVTQGSLCFLPNGASRAPLFEFLLEPGRLDSGQKQLLLQAAAGGNPCGHLRRANLVNDVLDFRYW